MLWNPLLRRVLNDLEVRPLVDLLNRLRSNCSNGDIGVDRWVWSLEILGLFLIRFCLRFLGKSDLLNIP